MSDGERSDQDLVVDDGGDVITFFISIFIYIYIFLVFFRELMIFMISFPGSDYAA
jgi:hypothetical protein